jgi:hypothetical protein
VVWLVVGVDEAHRFPGWDGAVDCYRAMVRAWTGAHGDPAGVATEVAELPTGESHQAVFADPEGGRSVTFSIGWEADATAAEDDADDDYRRRISAWYPEIAAVGDAGRAWQAEFDRLGSPIRVHGRHTMQVGERDHWVGLSPSPWERSLYLHLHTGEARWPAQLEATAPDLAVAAVAASLWLARVPYGELAAACPFLGSVALVEAKERGDEQEHSWLDLYENPRASRWAKRLAPFIALAFHEPRLRALRPYASHGEVSFSTTPTWPFTGNHPWIGRFEQYHVKNGQPYLPDGYAVTTRGRIFFETDAHAALARVLAELRD